MAKETCLAGTRNSRLTSSSFWGSELAGWSGGWVRLLLVPAPLGGFQCEPSPASRAIPDGRVRGSGNPGPGDFGLPTT